MLPTNVMSFMKKMVATDETPHQQSTPENTGTFGKLKQTLSSSLLTAQDKVTNKMSPRPSIVPESDASSSPQSNTTNTGDNNNQQQNSNVANAQQKQNQQNNNQTSVKQEPGKPPSRTGSCRVCIKSFKPNEFSKTCFECQQRVCEDCASYSKLDPDEDATKWRCSVCRRKMASRVCIPQDSTDSCLDVPVLEALQRRHSDVKLGSTNTLGPSVDGFGLAPPRSPELRRHSDVSPASLKELEKLKGARTPTGDLELRRGRSAAPSRSSSPPRRGELEAVSRIASRRPSRVSRQHSYDDEIATTVNNVPQNDLGLGLPAPMPRRKSAYDVYAPQLVGQLQQALGQQPGQNALAPVGGQPGSRRPSYRVPVDDNPQDEDSPDNINAPSSLGVDEDRPMRRRGSQLPDIAALRDRGALPAPIQINPTPYQAPALEDLEAPRRQTSLDGEAIKIVIHDVDSGPMVASKRRVVLRKDPGDKAHRTRGFGMRVVGGKTGADGRLFAYIVWTVPGGPAEKAGLQQGDKVLEWDGTSLIDRSFEEVCSIMDRTGEVAELLVEHSTDLRMCDLLEDGMPGSGSGTGGGGSAAGAGGPRKSGDGALGLGLTAEPDPTDKQPSSPTRRKLPKTPEQIMREKQVSGRVQVQVWYHGERNELVVSLMAADDLAPRDDMLGYGPYPEAYAKIRILPRVGDGHPIQTEVSPPTQSPIWNATLTFTGVSEDNLMDRFVEIQLWDFLPQMEHVFLGESNVDISKAFLSDNASWYRLEDPKGLRGACMAKSCNASPRGSLANADVGRLIRRSDFGIQRSVSDDVDSIGDATSLLHPDTAWFAGSRRGSSQSEQLEVEVYQLNKDFSRSLPGSRRSSFQNAEDAARSGEATPPISHVPSRRRSSIAIRNKDPEEILRSLKRELGRTMSLDKPEKKMTSRRPSQIRKESVSNIPELPIGVSSCSTTAISPADHDELRYITNHTGNKRMHLGSSNPNINHTSIQPNDSKMMGMPLSKTPTSTLGRKFSKRHSTVAAMLGSGSSNIPMSAPIVAATTISNSTTILMSEKQVKLGPCQVQPKGYRLSSMRYGELKLGFIMNKGMFEVEVIQARNIVPPTSDPPDTYVKCYVKDGERLRHKKKTRVVRNSFEPIYKQTLKYSGADIFGRSIVIMVWQRGTGFDHNQGLGGAEMFFDTIKLKQYTGGWYPLFPMHSLGSDSNDSP